MMVTLSKRLQAVAQEVLHDVPMADIGTDHGLLPLFLVESGVVPSAIASDVRRLPLQRAQETIGRSALAHRIALRCGDGLQVLRAQEAKTVVITGMGGATIVALLCCAGEGLHGVRRLVLQPQGQVATVRRWLVAQSWCIQHEQLVHERGVDYVILTADVASVEQAARHNEQWYTHDLPDGERVHVDTLYALGALFVRKPSQEVLAHWEAYEQRLHRAIAQMEKASHPLSSQRRQQWCAHAQQVRQVIASCRFV